MSETETLATTELHQQIKSLYNQGLYLQAYELSKQWGPLPTWKGTRSVILGARLASQIGSVRTGRTMLRMAYRQDPSDHELQYFYTYAMMSRRGVYKTFQSMQELGDLDGSDSIIQTDWFALRSLVFAAVRDFEKADQWIERAIQMEPERAWLYTQRSTILDYQDRPEESIASSEQALKLRPWFRPAVQDLAHRYVQAQRDDEAIDLLQEGLKRIESGDLRMQLGSLFMELERYEEARELFKDIRTHFPLLKNERKTEEALAAMSANINYYCGNYEETIAQAKKANSPFFDKLAERLTDKDFDGSRVRLPVKFVRQNHMTCAPATLTSITNYWGVEAEHLDIVEKICYDGTPGHNERRWARESGFKTREFRVTWDTAVELLDRGIPFTLTTTDPGTAHLQAVIGYDKYRRTLQIRDPGDRHLREFDADKMLEHYQSTGPRGMFLVPADKSDLVDGLYKLRDAKMYDLYYQLQIELERHQRDKAAAVLKKMESAGSERRLTLNAQTVMARYDSDLSKMSLLFEKLQEKYPKDVNIKLAHLACMSDLGKAEDRIETLREYNEDPECDPIFWTQLAGELSSDDRERSTVNYLLYRALLFRGHDATPYSILGELYFAEQQHQKGIEAYRFAACIDEKNEARAKQYFYAARIMNDVPTAMRFLQDRVARFGNQSSLPARTLCWAFDQLEQVNKALDTLKEAYKTHKTDGDFLLYTAEYFARWGKFDKSEKLLAKAKSRVHESSWTRIAALIAVYQGNNQVALKYWKTLLDGDPLDYLAHRYATGLIADESGTTAAITHLREYVQRFPYSYPLRSMLIEWLRDESADVMRAELNDFLVVHPEDAWALRELSLLHLGERDFDRAAALADQAHLVDPNGPATYHLRGQIHNAMNEPAKAIEQFREALTHGIDNDSSIVALVNSCNSKADRIEQLQFILEQLHSQVGFGDGLLTYHALAQSCIEQADLLKTLQSILAKDADGWHVWVAVVRQLSDMQRHQEAIDLATKGTHRFPLLPRMWMELASANSNCGKTDAEIAALRKAKEINPTWGESARRLAEALEKKGDLAGARSEIEAMIRDEPRDVLNYGFLAGIMWDQDEKEEALQLIAKAVRMQPGYEYGWAALRAWCAMLGKPDYDVEVATELTESRPNETRSWLMLALALDQPHQVEESIAALDKGIKFNPLSIDCHNQKVVLLCQLGQYDQALDAARPAEFGKDVPIDLVARAAWVEGERGNFGKAVAEMERVLQVDPDYYWAWQELAQWYRFLEKYDDYLKAANQLIRLQPQNAISWGYLAEAELAHDRPEKAKTHFQQAVQLAPTYSYASGRLLDMLVADKNWDEANAVLDYVAPHLAPEWVVSEQSRIAALSGDKAVAFEKLQLLCEMPSDDHSAIDGAVESMYLAEWKDETLEFLTQQLEKPDALPGVAFVFVHLCTTMKKWALCEQKLKSLQTRPELWSAGAEKFMEEAATAEQFGQQKRMRKFLKDHEKTLRASTRLWEHAGSALCQGDMDAATCKWMSDWKNHPEASSWGLFSLVCSLWDQKREHEAWEVSEHVIKNREPDSRFGHHLLCGALYHIVYGDPETAFELVRDVDPMEMNIYFQMDYEYVVAILQCLGTKSSYSELAGRLKATFQKADPAIRKVPFGLRRYHLAQFAAARLYGKKIRAWNWKRKAG